MPTFTEDAIRRRELAAVGVTAEVDTDGHQAVVRLDVHALDALIGNCVTPAQRENELSVARDAAYQSGDVNGWGDGVGEGFNLGYDKALEEINQLAELSPEQLAELAKPAVTHDDSDTSAVAS